MYDVYLGFPCGSAGKESTCNEGGLGLIPGLERSPGEGKGYPLQDSGLENSIECIVHGVTKSQTRLSDFHFISLLHPHVSLSVQYEPKRSTTWWAGHCHPPLWVKPVFITSFSILITYIFLLYTLWYLFLLWTETEGYKSLKDFGKSGWLL